MKRIVLAAALGALLLAAALLWHGRAATVPAADAGQRMVTAADTVVVYMTPTCGCCDDWADHVRTYGFTVVTHHLNDLSAVKRQLGVPAGRISCHTAVVRGYTVEGHVPGDLIVKMLAERPRFRGLAVPGMPMGSPGMEGPYKEPYDVLAFDDDGNVHVYARR